MNQRIATEEELGEMAECFATSVKSAQEQINQLSKTKKNDR